MKQYVHHFWVRLFAIVGSPLNHVAGSLCFLFFLVWFEESGAHKQETVLLLSQYWRAAPPPTNGALWELVWGLFIVSALLLGYATWVSLRVRGASAVGQNRRWTRTPNMQAPLSRVGRVLTESAAAIACYCVVFPIVGTAVIWMLIDVSNPPPDELSFTISDASHTYILFHRYSQEFILFLAIGTWVRGALSSSLAGIITRTILALAMLSGAHWFGYLASDAGRWATGACLWATVLARGPVRADPRGFSGPHVAVATSALHRRSQAPHGRLWRDAGFEYGRLVAVVGVPAAGVALVAYCVSEFGVLRMEEWVLHIIFAVCAMTPAVIPVMLPLGMPSSGVTTAPGMPLYNGSLHKTWAVLPVSQRQVMPTYVAYGIFACSVIGAVLIASWFLTKWPGTQGLGTIPVGRTALFALLTGASCAALAVGTHHQRRRTILWNMIVFFWIPTAQVLYFLVARRTGWFTVSRYYDPDYVFSDSVVVQDYILDLELPSYAFTLILAIAVAGMLADLLGGPVISRTAERWARAVPTRTPETAV